MPQLGIITLKLTVRQYATRTTLMTPAMATSLPPPHSCLLTIFCQSRIHNTHELEMFRRFLVWVEKSFNSPSRRLTLRRASKVKRKEYSLESVMRGGGTHQKRLSGFAWTENACRSRVVFQRVNSVAFLCSSRPSVGCVRITRLSKTRV